MKSKFDRDSLPKELMTLTFQGLKNVEDKTITKTLYCNTTISDVIPIIADP